MSGRIPAQDIIDAFYGVVGDDRPTWLDDLIGDAGHMHRCPCGTVDSFDG